MNEEQLKKERERRQKAYRDQKTMEVSKKNETVRPSNPKLGIKAITRPPPKPVIIPTKQIVGLRSMDQIRKDFGS